MKVGLVYTSTTPELIELVEKEIKSQLGDEAELMSYEDPTVLSDAREAGYVTPKAAAKLISLYMDAVKDDADAIINLCSSVGEVADASMDISKYIGVPIVRVDEEMCREAVRVGKKIAVMATLPTTLEPTKNTVLRVAREMGKKVELVDALVEGAFGLNQSEFKELMAKKANEVAGEVDVILFAQGSMAYCEGYISDLCKKTVLSSPRFGAIALKTALMSKGTI
ncbi:MAG: aspartate/glutamate racemase family protein [Lachnospirales bacterium]